MTGPLVCIHSQHIHNMVVVVHSLEIVYSAAEQESNFLVLSSYSFQNKSDVTVLV